MSGIVDVKFPILKEKKTTQIFRLLLSSFVYYGAVTSVVALVSKHSAGVIFLVALTPGWLVMVMNMVMLRAAMKLRVLSVTWLNGHVGSLAVPRRQLPAHLLLATFLCYGKNAAPDGWPGGGEP